MRSLLRRSSLQPRFAPCLESLEDRRLLSGLLPLGVGDMSHTSSPSALTGLVAAPVALLSPVTTTVQHLGGAVLGGFAPGVSTPSPAASPPVDGLDLHLNVDVLFVHLDQVHLNVGLASLGSSQPLVSLGLSGTAALGGQAGALLNIAPEVNLDLGGSNVVSLGVGSAGALPPLPDLPGGVAASPAGGQGAGAVPGVVGSILGDLGSAAQGSLPTNLGAGLSVSPSMPPAVNVVVPPHGTELVASANALALGGASSPSDATAAAAQPVQRTPDGGAGTPVNADAPLQSAPLVDDGAAGDPVAPPPVQLAGGGEVQAAALDLAPEGSGLATRFQPDGVGRFSQAVAAIVAAPRGGWLAALLARLAPYLAALIVAGVGFDLERRRRLRRAAKAAAARS